MTNDSAEAAGLGFLPDSDLAHIQEVLDEMVEKPDNARELLAIPTAAGALNIPGWMVWASSAWGHAMIAAWMVGASMIDVVLLGLAPILMLTLLILAIHTAMALGARITRTLS